MTATEALLDDVAALSRSAPEVAVRSVQDRFESEGDWTPLTRLLAGGGKGIRPGLVALGAWLASRGVLDAGDKERILCAGAAVELMHVGSLYHDDVLDHSDVRRGQPTVHLDHGNEIAILLGDILFAIGSELAAELGRDSYRTFSQTLRELCHGQIAEVRMERNPSRRRDDYLSSICGKTAALISCAVEMGGIVVGAATDERTNLRTFGHEVGLAFQIRDDVLDLVATPDDLGKEVGQDLEAGVLTLPVIIQCEVQPELVEQVRGVFRGEVPASSVAREVVDGGGVAMALDLAAGHERAAAQALDRLVPDGVDVAQLVAAFLPPLPPSWSP
jgi:heptaprenyl diphosphate synthase